jgi:hypothetical protein
LLAIPVLVIAWNDPNAFFFLSAAIVLVVSLGVMSFIFIPKFYMMHFGRQSNPDPRKRSMYAMSAGQGSVRVTFPKTESNDSSRFNRSNYGADIDVQECNQHDKENGDKLDEDAQPTETSLVNSASSGMAMVVKAP